MSVDISPAEAYDEAYYGERCFPYCWQCGGFQEGPLTDEWPLCDNCVIRLGPNHYWDCDDESRTRPPRSIPVHLSLCHFNQAYLGRWEQVFQRRALSA